MALTGHSGMHTAQSMHSSGSITSMLGPSRKQSTGQTSTQSVYLQRIQDSVTTWVIFVASYWENREFYPTRLRRAPRTALACTPSAGFDFVSTHQHGARGLVAGGVDQDHRTQDARAPVGQGCQWLLQRQVHMADGVGLE